MTGIGDLPLTSVWRFKPDPNKGCQNIGRSFHRPFTLRPVSKLRENNSGISDKNKPEPDTKYGHKIGNVHEPVKSGEGSAHALGRVENEIIDIDGGKKTEKEGEKREQAANDQIKNESGHYLTPPPIP